MQLIDYCLQGLKKKKKKETMPFQKKMWDNYIPKKGLKRDNKPYMADVTHIT